MQILYVDDDLEDIEIFHEAVHAVDPSIQYSSVQSARELLELLPGSEPLPDHIILDINMPGMDGRSCLEEIRKDKRYDHVNVVIYSTNSFPGDVERIEALGASFVRKANSFQELCDIIRRLTEAR